MLLLDSRSYAVRVCGRLLPGEQFNRALIASEDTDVSTHVTFRPNQTLLPLLTSCDASSAVPHRLLAAAGGHEAGPLRRRHLSLRQA